MVGTRTGETIRSRPELPARRSRFRWLGAARTLRGAGQVVQGDAARRRYVQRVEAAAHWDRRAVRSREQVWRQARSLRPEQQRRPWLPPHRAENLAARGTERDDVETGFVERCQEVVRACGARERHDQAGADGDPDGLAI